MQTKFFIIATFSKLHVFHFNSCIVVTVNFDQSTYDIDQRDGPAQIELVISAPSSIDINVRLFNIDETATAG